MAVWDLLFPHVFSSDLPGCKDITFFENIIVISRPMCRIYKIYELCNHWHTTAARCSLDKVVDVGGST